MWAWNIFWSGIHIPSIQKSSYSSLHATNTGIVLKIPYRQSGRSELVYIFYLFIYTSIWAIVLMSAAKYQHHFYFSRRIATIPKRSHSLQCVSVWFGYYELPRWEPPYFGGGFWRTSVALTDSHWIYSVFQSFQLYLIHTDSIRLWWRHKQLLLYLVHRWSQHCLNHIQSCGSLQQFENSAEGVHPCGRICSCCFHCNA